MAHAYTPGLRVTNRATIRKERRLPIAGQVLVEEGQAVKAPDVVARAELPGDVVTVNVVGQLGLPAGAVRDHMLKRIGEKVSANEAIAETRPWIKWLKSVARSPADGTIETVSEITGQVLIRKPPRLVELTAYIDGVVVEVRAGQAVTIEATGAFVQGIFGVGGETRGELAIACDGPGDTIAPGALSDDLAGKLVVAGALITSEVYERASAIGVAALVCGGFHDRDLRRLLGYDLGVAITGHEDLRTSLIITEGFGPMAMAEGPFKLLAAHEGRSASANGATQIRAGVLRPEIFIPSDGSSADEAAAPDKSRGISGLTSGSLVRIIRDPGFGRIGAVKRLPPEMVAIESEAKARVVEIEFPDGDVAIVPRANVEAIES